MNLQQQKSDSKNKVICSWHYLEWGGAQIYYLSIIKNAPANWEFTLAIPKDSKLDLIKFFEPFGVKFDLFETSFTSREANGVFSKLKRQAERLYTEFSVYRHLRKSDLKNSVVHADSAPWQSWIFLYLLARRGCVFVTMHNALPPEVAKWRAGVWRFRLNFLMKQKNFHFFAANRDAIESLKKYISPRYWDKLVLTRASINPREIEAVLQKNFDRDALLKKHALPANKFIVLCVGQFIDRKGRWIFLEAARQIAEKNRDIQFVWLTPQLPGEEDEKKIEAFGLKDSYRLVLSETVGKRREDVLEFFRIADVFALPSLWEGLPIAILEAMALGIPTISTDLNAIPEAVKNRETGLLVKVGDSGELAAAILKLLENEKLRKELGENGREFVLENFDEKYWAGIALENYEKCLQK